MKYILTILISIFYIVVAAQNTSTVITTGIGKTPIEAQHNAIRSALEQSFGGYISTNTTVLNDILIKDEITTITSGNILNYNILNAKKISNNIYTTTLEVIVSLEKLASYVNTNGGNVTFKGSQFYHQVKQLEVNKKAEITALQNILPVINNNIYDYKIDVNSPKKHNYQNLTTNLLSKEWVIEFKLTGYLNQNFNVNYTLLIDFLENISLKTQELQKLDEMEIPYYDINIYGISPNSVHSQKDNFYVKKTLFLRNSKTRDLLYRIIRQFYLNIFNFEITTSGTPIEIGKFYEFKNWTYDGEISYLITSDQIKSFGVKNYFFMTNKFWNYESRLTDVSYGNYTRFGGQYEHLALQWNYIGRCCDDDVELTRWYRFSQNNSLIDFNDFTYTSADYRFHLENFLGYNLHHYEEKMLKEIEDDISAKPFTFKMKFDYLVSLDDLKNISEFEIKPIKVKNIIRKPSEKSKNLIYKVIRDKAYELKIEGYSDSDIKKIISGTDKSNFKPQEKNIDHSNYDIDTILAKQFNYILNSLIYNKIEKKNFPFTQTNLVNNINTLTKDKELNPEYDYENNFDYNIYNYSIVSAENSYVKILFDTTKTQLFNNILSSQNDYNIIKISKENQWMTPIKIPFFTTQESADAGILDYTYFRPSLKETEFIKVHFSDNKSIKIFDAEKYLMDYIDYFISYYKIEKAGNDDNYVVNDNRYTEKQKATVLYWLYLLKQTVSGYDDMFIISEKY